MPFAEPWAGSRCDFDLPGRGNTGRANRENLASLRYKQGSEGIKVKHWSVPVWLNGRPCEELPRRCRDAMICGGGEVGPGRMAGMLITGKTVEKIVDDGEGLTSFYVTWLEAGGYFSVAKERGEDIIYCELNDQSNGFYSETVKYTMTGQRIKFWVSDDEYLDRSNRINEIEIVIPDKELDVDGISSCLEFIFTRRV